MHGRTISKGLGTPACFKVKVCHQVHGIIKFNPHSHSGPPPARVERGVRQRSVHVVIRAVLGSDGPFVASDERIRHGSLSYQLLYMLVGSCMYDDDIRTLVSNVSSVDEQVAVLEFGRENLLIEAECTEIGHSGALQE